MRHRPWRRGPGALRRPQVQLDVIVLAPAHLLPHKAQYQAIANALPHGKVLLMLPPTGSPERATMERVAATFRAKGRHITVLTEERVRSGGDR